MGKFLEFTGLFGEEIRESFDVLKFKKHQVLYSEGSTPLGIFYLKEGEVLISKLASQGREHVIRIISKEGVLCCADLLLNNKYSTSSRATRDSTVLFLPKAVFMKLLKENERINEFVLLQLAREVLSLEENLTLLAYKPLRGRLAKNLLTLCPDHDETSQTGICLSRIELAGFTGTVKETVTRLLSEFQKEKIISIADKQILILDKDRLQKISRKYD